MHAPDEALFDPSLLDTLLRAHGPMTVEALALQHGMDRRTVLAQLDRLRGAGCAFDEHPQHGVRLTEAGLGTWVDYLRFALGDARAIEVYRSLASTQDACRRLIAARADADGGDGAIVAAHEQTAGRGRFGRTWLAPPGATLTFSRACRIERGSAGSSVDRLTFAASVAVAQAVETLVGGRAPVRIKWPNDVCINGRKLAGILVETCEPAGRGRLAIVGIGLNVSLQARDVAAHDPALAQRITSMALEGVHVDRLLLLRQVIEALDAALEHTEPAALLEQWRRRSAQLEQPIRVRCDGRLIEGHVIDLDPHEGLIVRTGTGEIVHLPAAVTTVV